MKSEADISLSSVTVVMETRSRYAVDGIVPNAVALPSSEAEVAAVLREAVLAQMVVVPWGAGTRQDLGRPLERVDLVLSLEKLNRVVDYVPADMTITVEAGMRFAELQALTARHGQTVSLDPPRGASGHHRRHRRHGGIRPAPHGLRRGARFPVGRRVALPDGRVIKAGGKVVKNVAGYDMPKLFAGSLGTLGVITEVSLKLRPLPADSRTLLFGFAELGAAMAAAEAILNSELLPAAMAVLTPEAARRLEAPGPVSLAIALEETAENNVYQAERISQMLAADAVALVGRGGVGFLGSAQKLRRPVRRRLPNAGKHRHQRLGAATARLPPLARAGEVRSGGLRAQRHGDALRLSKRRRGGRGGQGGAGSDGGRVRGAGVGPGRAQAPGGRVGPGAAGVENRRGDPGDVRPRPHSQPRAVCGEDLAMLELKELSRANLESCVHCGFCLEVCPTYGELGIEDDSPRGRLHLIRNLAAGTLEPVPKVLEHLDLCLDCRACESSCPSGVKYGVIIEDARAQLEAERKRSFWDIRVRRFFMRGVFPKTGQAAAAGAGPAHGAEAEAGSGRGEVGPGARPHRGHGRRGARAGPFRQRRAAGFRPGPGRAARTPWHSSRDA